MWKSRKPKPLALKILQSFVWTVWRSFTISPGLSRRARFSSQLVYHLMRSVFTIFFIGRFLSRFEWKILFNTRQHFTFKKCRKFPSNGNISINEIIKMLSISIETLKTRQCFRWMTKWDHRILVDNRDNSCEGMKRYLEQPRTDNE